MTHERFRQLAALSLYGELAADETALLDAHLAACAECAAWSRRLGRGLGRLAAREARGEAGTADDLPAGWRARLDALVRADVAAVPADAATTASSAAPRATAGRAGLVGFALGLAAGLLAVLSIPRSASGPTPRPAAGPGSGAAELARGPEPFARATPPPHATTRGELARLGTLLREGMR